MPLEVAPSGHLVMVTDDYGRLPKETGGIKDSKLVMIARVPVAAGEHASARPIPPVSAEWTEAMRTADGRDTYWTPETWGGRHIGHGTYVFPPEQEQPPPPRAPLAPHIVESMNRVSQATYIFSDNDREAGDGTARSSRDTRATGSSSSN